MEILRGAQTGRPAAPDGTPASPSICCTCISSRPARRKRCAISIATMMALGLGPLLWAAPRRTRRGRVRLPTVFGQAVRGCCGAELSRPV